MTPRGDDISDVAWPWNTVATSGDDLPSRGEVWWVRTDKRRPAVVVQTDKVQKVLRDDFVQRLGRLSARQLDAVSDGLRLVLDLT